MPAALPLSEADEASAAILQGPNRHDAAIDLEHGLVLVALGRDVEASEVSTRSASQAAPSGDRDGALKARLAATEALLHAGLAPRALEVCEVGPNFALDPSRKPEILQP